MITLQEYIDENGRSPFSRWFNRLNVVVAAKVTVYLARIETGNWSQAKSIGEGVHECRIDYGPGYRIYFGKDGERLVILLGGGTKKRQSQDIKTAKQLWQEYKRRKRKEK